MLLPKVIGNGDVNMLKNIMPGRKSPGYLGKLIPSFLNIYNIGVFLM